MRIFVIGVWAAGSYLIKLLLQQGHYVSCGDRDPERARYFLGSESPVAIERVNARNLWSIAKAARGAQLLVNACPPALNQSVLRATLRLRAHYVDMAANYTGDPFRAEQVTFAPRFEEKRRVAIITASVASGLTNLLIAAGADLLDAVESVRVRLYEATQADASFSQWSAEASFDEAVARPRIYEGQRFRFGRRFGDRELFRFPAPIGQVGVVLAPQDEVITAPWVIPMKRMDVKFGGSDIDRLRRWYLQGKLRKSRFPGAAKFMRTPTPRTINRLFRGGILKNARFAASVIVEGVVRKCPTTVRLDAVVPSLFQLHRAGLSCSPISWATGQMAALFIKHFPHDQFGVHPPESLAVNIRRAILRDARAHGFHNVKRVASGAPRDL